MKRTFSLFALLMVSACASVADGQTQQVTIRTPGAENARCFIQNQDMKYSVFTDQTVEVMKSPNDLVVNCLAPGNREQTVHVKREVNDWVVYNVANGFVPGAAYDYFSRGAFDYPDQIRVSFLGVPEKPFDLPEHARLRHHDEYMGAGVVKTIENRDDQPSVLEKKENLYSSSDYGSDKFDNVLKEMSRPAPYDPKEEDK